ncbi:phosphoadenosine phosphosulfate reductase [Paenibacillus sp. Soil766]|uniref:phosphoadenylyl-sulfate reductase n=1 Tax=Paenibacillus sp. Soil766 TaxID=1736404 RepID=UPI00070AE1AF|nr:phosphoadenylyl-sulfate reductase [Paenibacillus sp. Soil766]KRE93811.1 phosphoadenosine phosphosulfate reductase [Paenibacillus sp. Soil766]
MNLFEKEAFVMKAAEEFENQSPEAILKLAVDTFQRLTLACSFGAEDVVLVDMLQKINPNVDIFYLDTNVHFQETYETKERLEKHYGTKFVQVLPKLTLDEQAEKFGDELWKSDANQCCNIRKVDPLTDILRNYDAWITGIRRDQAPTRANAKKVEYDVKFGLIKFNPLAGWTSEDVWQYIRDNDVIYNPLHDRNYPSIGCTHCTRQVAEGEDPRAGRWASIEKTECGLHK